MEPETPGINDEGIPSPDFESVASESDESLPLPPLLFQGIEEVEDDAEEVADESLTVAACEFDPTRRRKSTDKRGFAIAFGLAFMIHAAVVGGCIIVALYFGLLLPRLAFTQGGGSSESGLVSQDSNQADAPNGGVPGPIVSIPKPMEPTPIEHQDARKEMVADPQVNPPQTARTIAEESEDPLDQVLIGVATNPLGPAPVWHHAVSTPSAVATAAPAPAGTGANVAAPAREPATVQHLFVGPRGAGHSGSGSYGSGLDSRGLPLPEYPPESKRRHEEGTVEFEVEVSMSGDVASVKIAKTSGYPRLDDAALAAIRTARFAPATEDGKPIAANVIVPFRFILR